jgi:hypothetical protein
MGLLSERRIIVDPDYRGGFGVRKTDLNERIGEIAGISKGRRPLRA